jgi:uncharacterized protein YlzI (FlbEa/FlbD family)
MIKLTTENQGETFWINEEAIVSIKVSKFYDGECSVLNVADTVYHVKESPMEILKRMKSAKNDVK